MFPLELADGSQPVPSGFHNHTCFCDGRDTPEAMVREAIRLGCPAIGFSGHSYVAFDKDYSMARGAAEYRAEIARLRAAYAGRIDVYCGVEQDFYSDDTTEGYDYVIGAVHYLKVGDAYPSVDLTAEDLLRDIRDFFAGDALACAEAYFDLMAQLYERTHCDVVAHFDLLTKFDECLDAPVFDTDHPRYRAAATRALDALLATPVAFEVNTGAMARGYRTQPYPQPWIQDYIRSHGGRLIYTADCHDLRYLLFGLC